MDKKRSAFARNIAYLRKKHNVSRREIADLLGLKSDTTINKWETGVSAPSAYILIALSEYFNVSIDDLLKSDLEQGRQVYGDEALIPLCEQDRELLDKFKEAPDDIRRIVCVALKLHHG